ncbi:MAG: protein-disulfide reductase DsbD family protein [Planctomycetota bacterium]|jgi:thiol:disulfide interchange protein
MWKKAVWIYRIALVFALNCSAFAQDANKPSSSRTVELVRYEKDYSSARVEPARMGPRPGVAVVFEGTPDMHYYAKPETAPAAGLELKVEAESDEFDFGRPIFPKWGIFSDPLGQKVEVYVGRFTVFFPIEAVKAPTKTTTIEKGDVRVRISGIACTSMVCLQPFEKTLRATINFSEKDSWKEIAPFTDPATAAPLSRAAQPMEMRDGYTYTILGALILAFVAGLSLNIMPCVWPVLPLIIMRIIEQARQSKGRSIAMGLTFCLGILLFFACLAGINIVLQVFYGTVLQWGDPFRIPWVVTAMALLLVVLALFMFGIFTVTVPSSIAGKSGSGKGFAGALGMGFLAAILSTPCSFGILAAAFAWAQTQPLALGTLAIMVIGAGMALPYAILTSMPGLLRRMPKAGKWMEIFKQAVGFILLFIAIWLIAALPQQRRGGVLYFALALSFCVWMWTGWVDYNTRLLRKAVVRIIAAALVVWAGFVFLLPKEKLINWQPYDWAAIDTAIKEPRPVLIKFTADWCVSCIVVDKMVYSRSDIAALIEQEGVLAIKADTTVNNYPAAVALKSIYKEPGGVPVTILLLPGISKPIKFRGKAFADELKQLLQNPPSKQDRYGEKD